MGIPSFSNRHSFETHTAHLARGHDLTDSGYGLLSRLHECQAFLQERANKGVRECGEICKKYSRQLSTSLTSQSIGTGQLIKHRHTVQV